MKLKEKLLILEGLIRRNKPQLLSLMNDGLPSPIIVDKLGFIATEISNDILTFYEWKNGIREDSQYADELFLDGYFLNIDNSIDLFKIEPKPEWVGDFFPLFMGYGGVLILIGVIKNSINFDKVFFYDPTSGGTNVTHGKCLIEYCDSLEDLITSAIQCYEQGAYKINKDSEETVIDWELLEAIYRRNNPNSEYWKLDD